MSDKCLACGNVIPCRATIPIDGGGIYDTGMCTVCVGGALEWAAKMARMNVVDVKVGDQSPAKPEEDFVAVKSPTCAGCQSRQTLEFCAVCHNGNHYKPKPEPELPKSACSSCGSHAWMEDGSGWRCACGVFRLVGVSFSEKKPEPAKLEPSVEAVEALRSELSTYTDGMKDMIMKRCKECHQPTLNEPPICLSCYCRMNHPVRKEPEDYKTLYHELVMSVARAYPGETLHQTALRYIQQAETGTSGEASQTKKEKPQ